MSDETMRQSLIGEMAAIPLVQGATISKDRIIDESNQVAIAHREMTWRTPSTS